MTTDSGPDPAFVPAASSQSSLSRPSGLQSGVGSLKTDPRIPSAEEIVPRLTKAQRRAILNMGKRYKLAREIGTTGATLMSMSDMWRSGRGVAPPIQLTTWDVDDHEMVRIWSLTGLGLQVREILEDAA